MWGLIGRLGHKFVVDEGTDVVSADFDAEIVPAACLDREGGGGP